VLWGKLTSSRLTVFFGLTLSMSDMTQAVLPQADAATVPFARLEIRQRSPIPVLIMSSIRMQKSWSCIA
jgi:hypothetical protein